MGALFVDGELLFVDSDTFLVTVVYFVRFLTTLAFSVTMNWAKKPPGIVRGTSRPLPVGLPRRIHLHRPGLV